MLSLVKMQTNVAYYTKFSEDNCWSQPVLNGEHPKVRHGHVMVAVKNSIYLHGGMAGTEIFGDLWKLTIGMFPCHIQKLYDGDLVNLIILV
jgi:hypothetical protein